MKKIFGYLAAGLTALTVAACGEVQTIEQACADHGGVRAGSIERENDGSSEARCNDNVEVEQESAGASWIAEDE